MIIHDGSKGVAMRCKPLETFIIIAKYDTNAPFQFFFFFLYDDLWIFYIESDMLSN